MGLVLGLAVIALAALWLWTELRRQRLGRWLDALCDASEEHMNECHPKDDGPQ